MRNLVLERLVVDRLVLERLVLERMRWAALVAAAMVLTGCGGDSDPAEGPTNNASCSAASDSCQPFDAANYANQIARVDAYNAIKKTRKSGSFSAADFGDLNAVDGANKTPSDNTLAALYVETASLAEKVAGRKDDHAYAVSYNAGSAGAYLDELIRSAITQGAAADAVTRNAVGSIDWHGQRIDKGLQHFFYLSVFHEMMKSQADAAAAPDVEAGWDEGFGYFGVSNDGADQEGIAATLGKRDIEFGVTLVSDVFNGLVDGRCLVADVDYAGLVPIIDDVDISMLRGFALSVVHEMDEYSDDPLIKGWEGLLYWRIIAPYIADVDPTSFAAGEAEFALGVENIDTDVVRAAVTDAFGFDL